MWLLVFLIAFLVVAVLLLFVITSSFSGFLRTRVPFVRTSEEDVDAMTKYLKLSEHDIVYDLGSGDGTVVFRIARTTGAQAVGFETTLWLSLWARLRQRLLRSRARIISKNFFNESWEPATVLFCYLYPHLMGQVGDKVKADCRPGTRIVSRDFPIPNLPQTDTLTTSHHTLFIYTI